MTLPKYLPIENNPGLSRHTSSMAIVYTNKQAKTNYINQRDKIRNEKKKMEQVVCEIDSLKKEVNMLKDLVKNLCEERETHV